MDYAKQPLRLQIIKVWRYIRLYGLRRTIAKIQAERHMSKTYVRLPAIGRKPRGRRHVGIIGCGRFAYGNIAYYLKKNYGQVMRGAMDIDVRRAASLFEQYDLNYYTRNAADVLSDTDIDLIFIASNHASHAEYAIEALDRGKSVHIEKPHVVNGDQLKRLCTAMLRSNGTVTLGFNRTQSPIGRAVKAALNSQTGPTMYNWFVAGHEIPRDHWYSNQEEGGRVLGNLCHWTDFVYQMVAPGNRYPIEIRPSRARRADCDIAISYIFGDGSIAVITFSEANTFEGVREVFGACRGNALIAMRDFKRLVVEEVERKRVVESIFRNHGHEAAIRRSYEMVRPARQPGAEEAVRGCHVSYVWETGELFLRTKEALEQDEPIVVGPYADAEHHITSHRSKLTTR